MSVNKKISLITGANRGIGKAIAYSLIKNGSLVLGTATTQEGVSLINSYCGKNGKGYILNLMDVKSIEIFLKKVKKDFGEIDILINNAGIIRDQLLVRMKQEDWNKVMQINLNSVFLLSKFFIYSMIKKRYGRVISISSMVGVTGNVGQVNYATSKAGIIAFSKSLAKEVSSRGVTVNVVAPGFIESDMTKNLTDEYRSNILSKIPLGRFGKPEDVANVVIFLASDKASYITGETIHVNGGAYMI